MIFEFVKDLYLKDEYLYLKFRMEIKTRMNSLP